MSHYLRTTREMKFELLPDHIEDAVQGHLKSYNLGPILNDYEICIETISVKKKGLFKGPGDKQVTSYAILTPTWLVYAVMGDEGKAGVMSVPLVEANVEDYAQSPFFKKMPDRGYFITGNFTGQVGMHGRQQVSIFLGLGEERAARVFGEALTDAISRTRR